MKYNITLITISHDLVCNEWREKKTELVFHFYYCSQVCKMQIASMCCTEEPLLTLVLMQYEQRHYFFYSYLFSFVSYFSSSFLFYNIGIGSAKGIGVYALARRNREQ